MIYEKIKTQNDIRQQRLLYWSRLRGARQEYADDTGNPLDPVSVNDTNGFYYWMQRKYGIKLEFVDGNISGAYTVIDQKKLTLFLLRYPG